MSYSHRGQGSYWESKGKGYSGSSNRGRSYDWRRQDDRRWVRQQPWSDFRSNDVQSPSEGDTTVSESEGKGRWRPNRPASSSMPYNPQSQWSSRGSWDTSQEPFDTPSTSTRNPTEGSATAEESKGKGKSHGRDATASEPKIFLEPWLMYEYFPFEANFEDILLSPPVEFPDVVLVCGDSELRNQDTLSTLTTPEFLRDEAYGEARKFFARLLLGFMTKAEWLKYGFYCRFASVGFAANRDHIIIKVSKALSYHLRHNSLLIAKADEHNAVNVLDYNKIFSFMSNPRDMFRMASVIAMNPKLRFEAKIELSHCLLYTSPSPRD